MNSLRTIDKDSKIIYIMAVIQTIIMLFIVTKVLNYIMVDKTTAGEISVMSAGPIAAVATVGVFLAVTLIFFFLQTFIFKLNDDKANSKIIMALSIVTMLIGGIYAWKDMSNYTSLKFMELDKQITENNYMYNPATADFIAYKKESDNFTKCISTCNLTLNEFYAKKNDYLLVDTSLRDALKAEYVSIKEPVLQDLLRPLFKDDVFSVGNKIFLRDYLTYSAQPALLKDYPQLQRMLDLTKK